MLELPFALSASKISDWMQCPIKFWSTHLTKQLKFVETEAIVRGNLIHKELEEYGKHGKLPTLLLPEEYELITKIRAAKNAVCLYEQRFGFVDSSFNEVLPMVDAWDKAPNGNRFYLTGGLDVGVITGGTAVIIDHKTGKIKRAYSKDKVKANVEEGWLQLQIYAIYIFLAYPEVQKIKCMFNWIKEKSTTQIIIERSQLEDVKYILKKTCELIHIGYETYLDSENSAKYITEHYMVKYGNVNKLCDYCGFSKHCRAYQLKQV